MYANTTNHARTYNHDEHHKSRSASLRTEMTSVIGEDWQRHSTAPTTPPKAHRGRKPIPDFHGGMPQAGLSINYDETGFGPGTVEYELAADYLRQSMGTVNRWTDYNQYQSRTINSNRSMSTPSIMVAPPTRSNSHSSYSQHQTVKKKGKERETFNGSGIYATSIQQQFLSSSIPIEDIDIEPQQFIVPVGALFFLFGFLIMPLWWFGSCYPRFPSSKSEYRWRCYNRMMSVVSVIILFSSLAFATWALS
ncbi:hypothetical protein K7432_011969 [Basidiobolus ranarum]|uniref:Uncharacterized protein n=1 Tax=Basidiobolus ranarum TaxID=34480 RepID=A0ABR2VT12_9FUNG